MRASESAVQVMREAGIDLRPHRSHELTREWIDAASLIVVMTSGHREQLRDMASQATYKVSLLKSFNPAAKDEDIADPIGSTGQTYRTVRDEIAAALPGLIAFMKTLRKPKASG
jgi:protein-tyrosine-phosphatase